jgi:hypothetical protein
MDDVADFRSDRRTLKLSFALLVSAHGQEKKEPASR